jgi:hypothetical protein
VYVADDPQLVMILQVAIEQLTAGPRAPERRRGLGA